MIYCILFFSSLINCISLCSCFQTFFANVNNSPTLHQTMRKQTHHNFAFLGIANIRPLSKMFVRKSDIAEEEAFERAKKQLKVLSEGSVNVEEKEATYQNFIKKPANSLKEELKKLKLSTKGRKPDLAQRLVDHIFMMNENDRENTDSDHGSTELQVITSPDDITPLKSFASIKLSEAAGRALAIAGFTNPTTIQSSALPHLIHDKESLILHAETGSGKTLCYLLPVTESLWNEDIMSSEESYALILTPTRELAAQVAGIASVLSPPNSVRLITTPTNLVRESYESREKSEFEFGGRLHTSSIPQSKTKIIVGSAKSIMISLFGDEKLPSPPTSKPEAKMFLQSVKYVVMDEVDRLLGGKKNRGKSSKYFKKHERPAASIVSSIVRMTLGKAQIVAASATVGRPLRRELARVLGLTPDECPRVIVGTPPNTAGENTRLITLPKSLQHYVMPCDGSSAGGLITTAAFLVKNLPGIENRGRRILFVITSGCGVKLRDAIGALRHFGVNPDPISLLDVMQADGTDNLIEAYRCISGSAGIGEKSTSQLSFSDANGYLLVAAEESVRGIHLDNLDNVIVVGRPKGPDEYVHIAGRAGRAGKQGKVISIVSFEQGTALSSWEGMLGITFFPLSQDDSQSLR